MTSEIGSPRTKFMKQNNNTSGSIIAAKPTATAKATLAQKLQARREKAREAIAKKNANYRNQTVEYVSLKEMAEILKFEPSHIYVSSLWLRNARKFVRAKTKGFTIKFMKQP